mmetsp:Transcript_2785/g.8208  ORF Transcript_2785/g.8208 Transcript_2785/m.8208 type:complete len:137 (-) Transcript_2785:9-419(-)
MALARLSDRFYEFGLRIIAFILKNIQAPNGQPASHRVPASGPAFRDGGIFMTPCAPTRVEPKTTTKAVRSIATREDWSLGARGGRKCALFELCLSCASREHLKIFSQCLFRRRTNARWSRKRGKELCARAEGKKSS